jgi:hypothetical protein
MKKLMLRWGAASSFLLFLAGCKGCTVIPKPDETAPASYRGFFLEVLKNRTLPRSVHAFRQGETYRYESDARELKIMGPPASRLGTYLISQSSPRNGINLQAPHGDSDLKTKEIAELMCQEQSYDSCSINTMHRRSFDFAHESDSPFQEFTEAVVIHDPNALIVQLHGFESSKRKNGPEQKARMILSTGQDSRALRAALAELRLDQDPGILVYGVTTQELGATRNVQAGLVRRMGRGHFLHIETSLAFREKLQNDRKERDFLDGIIRAVKKQYAEKIN